MKIVHLLTTTRFAGSERYAIELANAQSKSHHVTLLMPKAAAESRPDALLQHVISSVNVELMSAWRPWLTWQARRRVRQLAPDVAHAHLSGGCKALRGWQSDHTLRVATLHIHYKPQQHDRMDALIAIAPWQLGHIPVSLRSHTAQIDNWTYPKIVSSDARRRLRQAHGIGEHEFLIGTLGRSEKSKGLDTLIDAFVGAKLSGCRLVLVGDGRDWQSLRRRAPASVVMPGYTSTPQDWLAAMDLFVSAARSEPFGLVFLEAMQIGLPILATSSQGAQHLGEQFAHSLLPIGDIPAMTQALRQLHAARPGRQHYDLSRFDGQQQVDRIEAFYRAEMDLRGQQTQVI